ncbi:beta-ketoacyl synthase N-terminal-like domain-containing protein [Lentzea sp. JNUCC 0626]|uniref:beta-ketoacyl synthase N-terminal-like domain-containing protein n=1 Tax=Lentzea sp. JNUCC 0626 TaxID=3367513 RepID=UPI003747DCA0
MKTISELLVDNAREFGSRDAYSDDRRTVTWSALADRTGRLAAGLDVPRGARVAVLLDDGVDLVEAVFAVARAAAVCVLLSPHATEAELRTLLADCTPSLVICSPRLARSLPAGVRVLTDVEALAAGGSGVPRDDLGLDEPAWMLYTSGTTGAPKGAVSTQRAGLWSPSTCYGPVLGMSSSDRLLWPLPMAHSWAHTMCLLAVLTLGAEARVCGRVSPAELKSLLRSYAPTVLTGVPTTYRLLLESSPEPVPSLRFCLTAGAPSDPGLLADVGAALGAPLLDLYGATETCGAISIGAPAAGVSVRIVDGEIQVRSPGLFSGYFGRPDETARVLRDGWYLTGDLGRFSPDGVLHVTGRVGDLIIRGGQNVDPVEVESVLLGLPGVRDAAVVARPDAVLGEVPVAFVVGSADGGALLRACAEVLSPYKVPVDVRFVDAVPRTGSGKARRNVLRAQAVPFAGSLVQLVLDEVASLCGVADLDTAFADIGMTSLDGMTLRHRLSERTGLSLPSTLVWDHPTPSAVAAHLASLRGGGAASPVVEPGDGAEPIAIVAVGCRFPGGVRSPEDLWRLVADGVDATSEFPVNRDWDPSVYDPSPDAVGKTYSRRGGFLHDAADFDAGFFGISPREAVTMDPQQRLLLEVAWETIERGGIAPTSLSGSDTAVFVGLMHNDHAGRVDGHGIESHLALGSTGSVASGRISYVLGLRGPSLTIDTACSSSLVAMHLAARSLRAGECSLALAGGVTVMATPGPFVAFSQQRALSPDGRCRSFSASADGTGWAEGAGLVLLERLADAERLGHPVLGVLRGSAVNSDGASNGLTAPHGPAQQAVIRAALADAGLRGSDVDVVEGHGTGTTLGDPIEASALVSVYGGDRAEPLRLGSVKSNIGHTQAAAGVASLIKVLWAMRHSVLPRSLHADTPSPHVSWSGVRLLASSEPWTGDRPRRAGISSFGISGTNAHVIVEEPPARPVVAPGVGSAPWLLSGDDDEGLRAHAAALIGVAGSSVDIAFSLATSRAHLSRRAAVLSGSVSALRDLAAGVPHPSVVVGTAQRPSLAFLFTGQGSQFAGMGADLAAAFPVFRSVFSDVCAMFDLSLESISGPEVDRTEYTQPALFAYEVAMCALLSSLGVRPAAVTGHSVGELAAAHVAGVLSLPDAVRLVRARGRAMASLRGGAMVAVRADPVEAQRLADSLGVSLAAVNGPGSAVLSGPAAALADVPGRPLGTYAFHSALLDDLLAEFRSVAESITYSLPRIPFFSTLTGRAETSALTSADYWVRQARETVLFASAIRGLSAFGATAYAEVGPSATLTLLAQESASGTFTAMSEGVLDGLATLHVHGVQVDWSAALPHARRCDLPTYPFQRERYWLPAGTTPSGSVLSAVRSPWLADHRVGADVLVPATAFIEMAWQATGDRLDDFVVHEPLVLGADVEVQVLVDQERTVSIWSRSASTWTRHVSATAVRSHGPVDSSASWPPPGTTPVPVDYAALAARGYHYGPAFRGVTALWRSDDSVFAEISLPDSPFPCVLDAALHASVLASGSDEVRVPFAFDGVELFQPDATSVRAHLTRTAPDTVRVLVTDTSGNPVARIDSLTTRPLKLDVVQHLTWVPASPTPADGTLYEATDVTATLEHLQSWLATSSERLTVVTRNATTADPDLSAAAIWGLVSSAQAEHPTLTLVDLRTPTSTPLITSTPRLAIADSTVLQPELAPAPPPSAPLPDFDGPVLITGGTSALAEPLARYLAPKTEHLILASRTGRTPDWAADLPCRVTAEACDVSHRDEVFTLVATHPPSAVFHLAGVLDDGLLSAMTPERLAAVMSVKAQGAWHLHEATADLPLTAFVLYSSASGVLGRPGQSNYAAANAYLDALARHRTARGLPAHSLAWGLWDTKSGMGAHLPADGVVAMTADTAIAALDRALRTAEPVLVPIQLAPAAPPAAEWADVESGVRATVASVLGYADASALPSDREFGDLGFDSLTALQVRNRINAATGLKLAATLVFDQPTLPDLVAHVQQALATEAGIDPDSQAPWGDRVPTPIVSSRSDNSGRSTFAGGSGLVEQTADGTTFRSSARGGGGRRTSNTAFAGNRGNEVAWQPDTARPASSGGIADLYQRVLRHQGPREAMALRYLASYALPTSTTPPRQSPLRLTRGKNSPTLVYLPSYLTPPDRPPLTLASHFDPELLLLPYPGFGDDPTLPADVETLLTHHSAAIPTNAVLIGHCLGGVIAQALADRANAKAVVLIDTDEGVLTRDDDRALALIAGETRIPNHHPTDAAVLAGGGYVRLFDGWRPPPSTTPTLLLQAGPTPEMRDPDRDWRAKWPLPCDTRQIPGDHDTVLTEHAATTAQAIKDWLARPCPASPSGGRRG